jgi:hypothetical protein
MMTNNIRAGEALDVKYVLNRREIMHGLLVWQRRRRLELCMRPLFDVCGERIFIFPFFFFPFVFRREA